MTDLEKKAMHEECLKLLQWSFVQIRYICGHVHPTYFYKSETGLTSGEQAWIWALAEFSHNIPHLIEYDFSQPLYFVQLDCLKLLHNIYMRNYEEIIGFRAKNWTKERIYALLFPQSFNNTSLCEDGQSTGNDDA